MFLDQWTVVLFVPHSASVGEVYEEHRDEDGFLYVQYSGENTFGAFDYLWNTFIACWTTCPQITCDCICYPLTCNVCIYMNTNTTLVDVE